jgi:hypothetical protein
MVEGELGITEERVDFLTKSLHTEKEQIEEFLSYMKA